MGDSEHTVRLTEDGPLAFSAADGLHASQDNPLIEGLSASRARYLVKHWSFEDVEGTLQSEATLTSRLEYVLEDGTIGELEGALGTGDFDSYLGVAESMEQERKDRSGAYDAIEHRRETARSEE